MKASERLIGSGIWDPIEEEDVAILLARAMALQTKSHVSLRREQGRTLGQKERRESRFHGRLTYKQSVLYPFQVTGREVFN